MENAYSSEEFKERWQKMSLAQQMGNIGSEVNLSISLKEKGDKENMEKSVFRALELIDLTISDKRWKGRLHEIFRLREIVCDTFLGENIYKTKPEFLKNYFLFFALNI